MDVSHTSSGEPSWLPPGNYCLLCSSKCPASKDNLYAPVLEIPGAGKSEDLHWRLEKMFIVRKILDVDAVWCENLIRGASTNCLSLMEEEQGDWFRICPNCLEGSVARAWKVWRKILELKGKFEELKTEIKGKMRTRVIEETGDKRKQRFREGRKDFEIRRAVFPELFVQVKEEPVYAENVLEDVDHFGSDHAESEDPLEGIPAILEEKVIFPSTSDRKRKRGRPRKGVSKNYTRHPEFYYDRHRGTLKRKQFRVHVCRECDARYKCPEEYESHLKAHEEVRQTGGHDLFICKQCTFPGRTADDLAFHVQRRHTKPKGYSQKHYKCTQCSFVTMIHKLLAEHEQKEHGKEVEADLKCNICGSQAANLQGFLMHRQRSHPELELENQSAEGIQCSECPEKFASNTLFQQHFKNVHRRINRFVCEVCGIGFPTRIELRRHNVTHMNKSQGQVICHLCGLPFRARPHLLRHIGKAHKRGKKVDGDENGKLFKCKFCDITSPFKFYIRQHLESHQAEMKYECEICGKRYMNPQGKSRHKLLIHKAEAVSCPYCHKEFTCEPYMKDHVKKYCKIKKLDEIGKLESFGAEIQSRQHVDGRTYPMDTTAQEVVVEQGPQLSLGTKYDDTATLGQQYTGLLQE